MLTPQPIRMQVRALLRNRLSGCDFQPGTIISPAELAKELQVSQTPIREALIELARDRLLENEPNRGFVVKPFTRAEAEEIYPLMWSLETLALRTAPPTPAQLDRLIELNQTYTVAEGPDLPITDGEWHQELLRGCRNETLNEMLELLRWRVRRYETNYLKTGRWSPQAPVQHHAMVLALRRGDTNRGAELLEANWKLGLELVVSSLSE